MGQPPCVLRETSRYTEASGAIIVRHDGADGVEYHCTVHTNGSRTWSAFSRNVPLTLTPPVPVKAI
jgi:hypothetical protein